MLRTKTIPFAKDRDKRGETDHCCSLCHRPIAIGKIRFMIHVIDGGGTVLHPDSEQDYQADDADMLWFPIGNVCRNILGKAWTITLEKEE